MDIKEIAQKLAPGYWKRDQWNIEYFDSVEFAEALIESYKAELLKEVGEPVGYVFKDDATRNFYNSRIGSANEYGNYAQPLFTSDQVAAAIIKATKPLEERRCEICGYAEHHREHTSCLRTQLAAAQEENDALRRIHKENIEILVKELSDKDYEYNQKTNRLIERHAEQLNRCDAEVKRLTGRKDGEVPNY